MSYQEVMSEHVAAFGTHAAHAIFTGLLPVLTITLIIYALLAIPAKGPTFTSTGALFAFVGATIGVLLGSSREPAVQAVVPAIVTLITGYLGWTLRQEAYGQSNFLSILSSGKSSDANGKPDVKFATLLVFGAISALMLSTITGAMWGASMRMAAQDHDRRYQEWRLQYEKVKLPLEVETLRRDLGLPAVTPAK